MAVEAAGAAHAPWETPVSRIGIQGLQLNKPLDQLTPLELSRLTNLYTTGGDLTSRPGQLALCTGLGGQAAHSVRRLNVPSTQSFIRFWGMGTHWLRGGTGALTDLTTGFSGNPLTLLETRPPLSGEPWMVAADSSQMRKASATSPALPVGLPAPTSLIQTALASRFRGVAGFDAVDGTQAVNWTPLGGFDAAGNQAVAPVLSDIPGVNGNGVNMAITFGPCTGPYYSTMAIARPLDLSLFDGGAATDDQDILHLAIRVDTPVTIEEIRVYFVVSPFSLGGPSPIIPGTDPAQNLDAYVHVYRPSDYAAFVANSATAAQAADSIRQQELLNGFTEPAALPGDAVSTTNLPGANVWTPFGVVDLPVRRGDFLQVGAAGAPGSDWSTVTGIYIMVRLTGAVSANVAFDDCYVTGGYGADSSEVGLSPYDWRATNVDPRTGAESNGTAVQDGIDLVRGRAQLQTPAFGDPNVRQVFYRRGGTITDNWRDVGTNAADGGPLIDAFADVDINTAATLPTDHFQPVATVTSAGVTVLAQPLRSLFGPFDDGTICGVGDPFRPGHVYACLPGEVDHWPSTGGYAVEACAPSEELMAGCVTGGQGLVFSRKRGYTVHANLAGGEGIVVDPADIYPGMATYWGLCVGPGGAFYVAQDGVRVTPGQGSELLSDPIRPLFQWDPGGSAAPVSVNGYAPIDWNHPEAIQLAVHNLDLWFLYQDTNGSRQTLIYSLLYRYWRSYTFGRPIATVASDLTYGGLRLVQGGTNGNGYTHEGFTDDGIAIPYQGRTGAQDFGRPREEKLLGDLILDADLQGSTLTVQTLLNIEATVNAAQSVVGVAGRRRYTFDPFGSSSASPQHARNVSVDLSGTAPTTAQVVLSFLGVAQQPQPDVTMNRVTAWEPLGNGTTEAYLYGLMIDCDTGGSPRTLNVEVDLAGAITTAAALVITSNGRHKLWFSWPAVHAQAVRLRPQGACEPWMLWRAEWLAQPEPPRIAGWDSNWEQEGDGWDRYYTGLDLECDTFGAAKTIQLYVDQQLIDTKAVQASGRRTVHLTVTPGRGHEFRFVAIDANPGLLYKWRWQSIPEPSEQTHWNAAYTVYSSLSDKYLKGILLELDSFGLDKTVSVEVDGVGLTTFTVNTNGRLIRHVAFPQVLGRVFRILPTDGNPSRLYTAQPIFDEEPLALDRWETQLVDHQLPGAGWGSIVSADITVKATADVTWTVQVYTATGALITTLIQLIGSTGGAKQKRFVPAAAANKGVLFKHLFTSAIPFTLYQEESRLRIAPWQAAALAVSRPFFGNDDLDTTRSMRSAVLSAGREGGGS